MTIHLHDLARTVHSERNSPTIEHAHRLQPIDHTRRSLRSLVGTALIRAGTRLAPYAAERRPIQSIPRC
jgi:hypothetical protein